MKNPLFSNPSFRDYSEYIKILDSKNYKSFKTSFSRSSSSLLL